MTTETKITEIDFDSVKGIENEEKDDSVGHYIPFCLVLDKYPNEQVQLFMDYEQLITIAKLMKPYLESFEAEEKMEKEMWGEERD